VAGEIRRSSDVVLVLVVVLVFAHESPSQAARADVVVTADEVLRITGFAWKAWDLVRKIFYEYRERP
jgi:hypothetical protein